MAWTDFSDPFWAYKDLILASKLNLTIENIKDNHNRLNNIANEIKNNFSIEHYAGTLNWNEVTSGDNNSSAYYITDYLIADWRPVLLGYRLQYDVDESGPHVWGIYFQGVGSPGKWKIVIEIGGNNFNVEFIDVIFIKKQIITI